MSKASNAVEALKVAKAAVEQVVNLTSIYIRGLDGSITVQLASERDLEQMPGQVRYEERDCEMYPIKAVKEFEGITFFCLVPTQNELREAI